MIMVENRMGRGRVGSLVISIPQICFKVLFYEYIPSASHSKQELSFQSLCGLHNRIQGLIGKNVNIFAFLNNTGNQSIVPSIAAKDCCKITILQLGKSIQQSHMTHNLVKKLVYIYIFVIISVNYFIVNQQFIRNHGAWFQAW